MSEVPWAEVVKELRRIADALEAQSKLQVQAQCQHVCSHVSTVYGDMGDMGRRWVVCQVCGKKWMT